MQSVIYGEHYSKSSISRMIQYMRDEVADWLDTAVGDPFPNVPLQRCTTHLKRGLMDKVKHGDKLYYMDYFTYLDYDYRIQSMIYTTNWIERLQKDFRRVTKMRVAMPNDESVLTLMGKTLFPD